MMLIEGEFNKEPAEVYVGILLVDMMLRIQMKQIRSILLSHGKGIEELITIPVVDRTIPGVDLEKVEEKEEDDRSGDEKFRSYARGRDRSRDKSESRGRFRRRGAVSFSEQSRRRDLTPGYFVDAPGHSSSQE